ncbi:hypothetical protein [Halobaculum marinum]|uniref:Uncharacterized protein n=1 Tax=Halobaculum marinum TaxID=3031996 RepID=A0ABD5WVK9_9EURY|nr:hypothetical protein [Halobaculum sp. DT55]
MDRPREPAVDARLLALVGLATLLSIGHHVDHLIRGNHVGWPVTPAVNAFTFSLGVYPVIATGLLLTLRGRAGARYWFAVAAGGLGLLGAIHLGPWAIEPPGDIIGPYAPSPVGYLAFAWLLALLAVLCLTVVVAAAAWRSRSPA